MAIVTKAFVFEDANDQHVRALKAYGKSADTKLYYDAAYTEQVTEEDALKFFAMSSLIIDVAGVLYAPMSINTTTHKVTTIAKSGSTLTGTDWSLAV